MHPIHQQWCKDAKEHKYTRGVQKFIKKMRWKSEESKEGGITWIELYALYAIHGGSRDEEARRVAGPLKTPPDAARADRVVQETRKENGKVHGQSTTRMAVGKVDCHEE